MPICFVGGGHKPSCRICGLGEKCNSSTTCMSPIKRVRNEFVITCTIILEQINIENIE